MALTEFHLVLLYSDRIAALSTLNESLVYEEVLPLVSTLLVNIDAKLIFVSKRNTGK